MRTFIFAILLLGAGYWLAIRFSGSKTPTEVVRDEIHSAVSGTVSNVMGSFEPEKLKAELAQSGEALRDKAVEIGNQVAAGTEDARITATIKSRLAQKDPATAVSVSVSTTSGLVTLSGTTKTFAEIDAAIRESMEVPGVVNVVSTLQIKP
jgi:osmotically-inducible protein OsmY